MATSILATERLTTKMLPEKHIRGGRGRKTEKNKWLSMKNYKFKLKEKANWNLDNENSRILSTKYSCVFIFIYKHIPGDSDAQSG